MSVFMAILNPAKSTVKIKRPSFFPSLPGLPSAFHQGAAQQEGAYKGASLPLGCPSFKNGEVWISAGYAVVWNYAACGIL